MNLEEIIRIHGNIHKFMGQHIITIISSLMTPKEIIEKTEKLNPVDPVFDLLPILTVPPAFKVETEIEKQAYSKLRSLSFYFSEDLEELLKLDFTSIATKAIQKQHKDFLATGVESTNEEILFMIDELMGDKKTSFELLKYLGIPLVSKSFNHEDIVQEIIRNSFSPLYEALNERTKEEQEIVKKEKFYKFYSELQSFKGPKYSWALLVSDEPLKNIMAFSSLNGFFSTTLNHSAHSMGILYEKIIQLEKENRKAQKLLDKLKKEIEMHEKNLFEFRKRKEDYELKIKDLENRPVKEVIVEKEVPVYNDDSTALEGLIEEIQSVKKNYDQKTAKLGKELAAVKNENEQLRKKLEDTNYDGELNSGTNYLILVTPELKERYVKSLFKYRDNTMNGVAYSEVIDDIIKKVCCEIKLKGFKDALSEFGSYSKEAHYTILKHNTAPARDTRIFLKADSSKLIIADIFTPDEHRQSLQNNTGRYYDANKGAINYTSDESKLIQIKKTIRELFEK